MRKWKTGLFRALAVCLVVVLASGLVVAYGEPGGGSFGDAGGGLAEGAGDSSTSGDSDNSGSADGGSAEDAENPEDAENAEGGLETPSAPSSPENPELGLEPEQALDESSLEPQAQEPVLAQGRYVIRFGASLNRVLDVEGASTANGANVALWLSHMRGNQLFDLSVDSKGYYTIKSASSGKVLDMAGGVKRSGTNVLQWQSTGALWQKWIIEKSGSQYVVRSAHDPSLYLDVSGARDANGANIQVWQKTDTASQLFDFVALNSSRVTSNATIAEGIYSISSALGSNLVLDVYGASLTNGAAIQIYSKYGAAPNQMFKIKPLDDGYYQIRALHSGQALDAEGAGVVAMTRVIQWPARSSDNDNQKWAIRDNDDGTVSFYAKVSGLALDVEGARGKAETRILLYTPHNNKNQRFNLTAVTAAPLSNGIYTITPASQLGQRVDVTGASLSDKADVIAYADNGGFHQKFKVTQTKEGDFSLQAINSGLYLTADGANVCQRPALASGKTPDATQRWKAQWGYGGVQLVNSGTGKAMTLTGSTSAGFDIRTDSVKESLTQGFLFRATSLLSAGYYRIASVQSGNLVDVYGASSSNGAAVQLYPNHGDSNQIWYVEPSVNGSFVLRNVRSGKLLDVSGGSTASGASVIQWVRTGGVNQRWTLEFGGDGWFIIKSALGTTLSATGGAGYETPLKAMAASNSAAQGFRLIPAVGAVRSVRLDVPLFLQLPNYPTGCEAASTAMMLSYAGYNVSIETVVRAMPYHSSNPNLGFVGNPRTWNGFTIYPPALLGVVRAYTGSAVDLTGASADTLRNYLKAGKPVVCWIRQSTGGLHCVIVTGFDAQNFYYNDPYGGKDKRVSNSTFASMRAGLGNRALSY